MPSNPKLTAAATKNAGLPERFSAYSPFPFEGMNVQASNLAIKDQEFKYVENFLRLGDGYLRTAWGQGEPIYRAPTGKQIVCFFHYNIGSIANVAVFLNDGTAVSVNVGSGMQTAMGGGFFVSGGMLPACGQWGILYLLISNRNTSNDYWAWDGSLLYGSGTAAPAGVTLLSGGSGYTSVPSAFVYGGHGSGMAVLPVIQSGSVVGLEITNPGSGYQVGDVVQVKFSGGGSDTEATMTANLSGGSVAALSVQTAGSGYVTPLVHFSGGGGTGAAATAIIGTGVSSIAVTAGGHGYTTAGVSFTGGSGSGATATATVVGGVVTAINVVNPGTGYTGTPTVTISETGGGSGTGATATATVQNSIITGFTLTAGGSGYTAAPTINITDAGGGTGATAQAILSPSGVASISVNDAGSGYTSVPLLNLQGGGGTGASAVATLNATTVAAIEVTSPGQNYQQNPTVLFNPSSYGVAATTVIDGGQIVAVVVTNGGSGITGNLEVFFEPAPNDTGTGGGAQVILNPTSLGTPIISSIGHDYTSAPAVIIEPGANNAAAALINLMPFGVSGAALETFLSRVWIANPATSSVATALPPGGDFQASAAENLWDFAISDGAFFFQQSDAFLQTKYTAIRQSNGYLYFFGDGSVSVASNVQTSGTPATTTLTYQNVDPQTGCSWNYATQDFGRSIIFANEQGVFGLYGGAVTKISGKLDPLFAQALFPPDGGAIQPSSATHTAQNVKHYHLLMTIIDPDLNEPRNVMVTWNEKEWVITSQESDLVFIGSQKIESRFQAWGTDGTTLFPLFAQPSATLIKRLDTKAYGANEGIFFKDFVALWINAQDFSPLQSGIDIGVTFDVSGLAIQSPSNASVPSFVANGLLVQDPNFQSPQPFYAQYATGTGGFPFLQMSCRLTTSSPDFAIGNLLLGYTRDMANY